MTFTVGEVNGIVVRQVVDDSVWGGDLIQLGRSIQLRRRWET